MSGDNKAPSPEVSKPSKPVRPPDDSVGRRSKKAAEIEKVEEKENTNSKNL